MAKVETKSKDSITTIFRKSGKRYRISFYDDKGARHTKTYRTYTEAKGALARRRGEVENGEFVSVKPISFKDFTEKWLDYCKNDPMLDLKDSTYVSYRGHISSYLLPFFGSRPLDSVSLLGLNAITKEIGSQGKARNTIKNITQTLKMMLNDAARWGYLKRNPLMVKGRARRKQKPQVNENGELVEKIDFLKITADLDEVALFLKACQEHEPKYYALFTVAIYTGLRRGELLALKWGDLDKANSILRVRRSLYTKQTKDGSAGWKFITPKSETSIRDVDIPESLIFLLELHRKKQNEAKLKAGERWQDHDLVFSTKFGTPLNPDNMVKRHFRRILKKAGLRHMPFHSLRHTYCSLKALDGANIQYTRQQMGHSDSRVTLKIYTHVMPIERKAEREKLDLRMRAQIGNRGENLVLQRHKAQSGVV